MFLKRYMNECIYLLIMFQYYLVSTTNQMYLIII